ncbi:MAG: hypothetical protein AAB209_00920, partial [Bacteroidota bacterium]
MNTIKRNRNRIQGVAVSVLLLWAIAFNGCDREFSNPNAPTTSDAPLQTIVTGIEAGMRTEFAVYLRVVSSLGK